MISTNRSPREQKLRGRGNERLELPMQDNFTHETYRDYLLSVVDLNGGWRRFLRNVFLPRIWVGREPEGCDDAGLIYAFSLMSPMIVSRRFGERWIEITVGKDHPKHHDWRWRVWALVERAEY